jgi:hypothetical protein
MNYLPTNDNEIFEKLNTQDLLPSFTRTRNVKTPYSNYNRTDPSILLTNPQNHKHIVTPELQRGGLNTRDYIKLVHGTSLKDTVQTPYCNKNIKPIIPEHIQQIGKDSPFLTYNK